MALDEFIAKRKRDFSHPALSGLDSFDTSSLFEPQSEDELSVWESDCSTDPSDA